MTSDTYTYVPVEGPIRDWLRTVPALRALLYNAGTDPFARVFVGIPDNPVYPLISSAGVVAGSPEPNSPLHRPVLQFDVWGSKRGDRATVEMIAATLAGVLQSVPSGTLLSSGAVLRGATVTLGPIFRPDPDIDRPRFEVDAQFTVSPA